MRERDPKKEKAIRQKALQLIVEKGFDGFSMQKLAKAAKISPATIYIYYENREDLLNRLYTYAQETFARVALKDFHPSMSLEEGLWLQWKNRLTFIEEYPQYYMFYEQFRNSPLINKCAGNLNEFQNNMKQFVIGAIQKGEMQRMEPELFWALAYGP